MGAISGEELTKWEKMQGTAGEGEEKILVLVRLRPLSEKEIMINEVSDWECINHTTILFRNSLRERSTFPTAYTFDKVFRGDCSTKQVYEDGTKEIALSAVGGINSTIFAYGQTSSGKTYTMNGITEYTVADIYNYIQKHEERAFALKFSAMEIYNEVVRDLLSTDSSPLRLLDDPERGTIIEKLTEETLRDWSHLKELLSICEAQRQIGETSLNEKSSRSHQILKLTIESSAREFLGKSNSTTLAASVNFVDLAGSERASQSLSVGQRLKEGCHINRSLLTLGTVIRKLSNGRHGHINYRDSKLTRILQPALGGNARTAIICTLSPARSHVEQTRNTLLFASCAKEVTTKAQVNVVMSDKALVKHLQKELARLESELRTPGPACDYVALLKKKDQQIQKLEKEVSELTKQRDLTKSRVEDLLRVVGNDQTAKKWDGCSSQEENTREDECSVSKISDGIDYNYRAIRASHNHLLENDEGDYLSDVSSSSRPNRVKFVKSDPLRIDEDSDDVCKEVRCIEMDESRKDESSESPALSNGENKEETSTIVLPGAREVADYESISTLPREIVRMQNGYSYGTLHQKLQDVQETVNSLAKPCVDEQSPLVLKANVPSSRNLKLTKSKSCSANLMTGLSSPDFEIENTPANEFEKDFSERSRKLWKIPPLNYGPNIVMLSRNGSQSSLCSSFIDEGKTQNNQISADEAIPSIDTFVASLKEMAKIQYQNQDHDTGAKADKNCKDVGLDPMQESLGTPLHWPFEFDRQQKLIIELWQASHFSLIHRTYFFLLFKGDPMDSIYMEVELRRLSFLKETFSKGNLAVEHGRTLTLGSSIKALNRERVMLSKLMNKRFLEEERNRIYQKWGIGLESKRRRLQLAQRLWSDTKDMSHIRESAVIVAKLISFSEEGHALKEMFGLSFTPSRAKRRSFGWKNSVASLL